MPQFDLEIRNLINLFSQTPELFCLLEGPEHEFTYVNDAHIKVLGFDATGKKVREAQPESVEVHGILDDVFRTGTTAHLRKIAVTIGKEIKYFNLTYAARKNSEGKITGIMILGSDITENVLSENRLKDSEEKLTLALSSARMGLWHYDLVHKRVTTSPSLNEILGVESIDEDMGKVNQALVHPDDLPHVNEAWQWAVEEKSIYIKDYRIIRPSGEIRWLSSTGRAKYDKHGRPVSFSGVSLDITEMKKTEQKLKEALRFRDDFLSVASHELKTPLTSLKLQIQTSLRKITRGLEIERELVENLLQKNNVQVDRLVRLVDDMLDLSRIQSGRLSFSFKKITLNDIIREIVENFREQFDNIGSSLTFRDSPDILIGMYDRERLDQVMINLLTNALKYGLGNPVSVRLIRDGVMARIEVLDQGTGIAAENFEKVFRKFERVVTPSEVSGLGIGLYISREIIEAHGGRIHIESVVGKGSTFIVELPLSAT